MSDSTERLSWTESLKAFLNPRLIIMLFLGFSAGLPLLLIFSSLSLWLREAGVERAAVTFFSWAALGYSFKFVWAPLVDTVPLPYLSRIFGRRRAWLLLSQLLIVAAILWMASIDPSLSTNHLKWMAFGAVLLGFSSATQDIVVDAFRIESAEPRLQALLSSTYIAGYRIAMVVSGAGALYLASYFGSEESSYSYAAWQMTYQLMAACMLVGVATTLLSPEPQISEKRAYVHRPLDYARLFLVFLISVSSFVAFFFWSDPLFVALGLESTSSPFLQFFVEAVKLTLALIISLSVGIFCVRLKLAESQMAKDTWVEPVADFFRRYGLRTALWILAFVGLYRISDIVLGVISNVFYQDMGFSKNEIATAVKTFGLIVTIVGGFGGGIFAARFGVARTLIVGAVLSVATNLLFVWLSYAGHNLPVMYTVVAADNLAAGFASAGFVAFLSSLTSVSFTAVQYSIFSSLMTLLPKVLGGYSGSIVNAIGYPGFFIFTTLIGVPVILLCIYATRQQKMNRL